MSPLVISAKSLGSFAVQSACPRCLWVQLHVKQLPYQIFPGIFSSLDAYNKRVVEGYFNREGKMPGWLARLGDVAANINPPHYTKFTVMDPETKVTLRGGADGIFRMRDSSYTIVDYKTARVTKEQHSMFSIYEAQLNGYAYIANRVNMGPVTQLALVYMEPQTEHDRASHPASVNERGFLMELSAQIVPVRLDPDGIIPPLLKRAQEVYEMERPPEGNRGCRDCAAVEALRGSLT